MIKDLFAKKKGKYTKYSAEIWGNPFYILVERDEEGKIKQIFEKPNFKKISVDGMVSGMHLVTNNPERNHMDWYDRNGNKIGMEKSDITPYWIKENIWGI